MNTLIQPLAAGFNHVSTQLIVQADGIIGTANGFNNELYALVVNGGLTVIVILFLVHAIKKGFGVGAILGGLFVAGLAYFALNGGLQFVGNLIRGEF
ncbi:hypothetical protein [Microbacterium paraoxydans]|uniref:hypothetical protein n=1 Tax=Microbacterium paraoxydans TaxID=199592 RepID=UPI00046990ED|nr:hypothetical protein [Microbacterium paraoxydans]